MICYHFTSAERLPVIREQRALMPTESNVGSISPQWQPFGAGYGPQVVWLLDVPQLDHQHGLAGSYYDKTAVRIAVDIPAIRWLDWAWTAKMNADWREAFVNAGGGAEAAEHWYVLPGRIPETRWAEIALHGRVITGVRHR